MSWNFSFIDIVKQFLVKFWQLHKYFVLKNRKFENLHKGETCYIFANGASLKYYDISNISRHPIIAVTNAVIDKRMKKLNVKYLVTTDSYSLYPLLYNTYPFVRKFQISKTYRIFKRILSEFPDVQFFVNLTNFYSPLCRNNNVNYFYHFGNRKNIGHNLAGSFSECAGALDIMIGMAKFFGFSKAVLVGCDYLGSPPVMGHFYADAKPFSGPYMSDYCARIKKVSEGIDVLVILPKNVVSPDFKYTSYEDHFDIKKKYVENNQIVDEQYLNWLRDAAKKNQAVMNE
jgi:hypothetical protein